MPLLGKNKEEEEPEEEVEEVTEEEVEEEPPPIEEPVSPAIVSARDGARVCALINQAVQAGSALVDERASEEDLQKLKDEAARAAARAAGTWQAIENGVLEVQAEAAQKVGILADHDKLAELASEVIISARNDLQDLLGQVNPDTAPGKEDK